MVPVEYDENGNILDGYNRVQICQELGITDWPRIVRTGLTEDQKREHARKLNLARRHLNQEQRRCFIRQQLTETPEKSDRQIAVGLGVSHHMVADQREELESVGQIARQETIITKDGKERPRQVERQAPAVFTPVPRLRDMKHEEYSHFYSVSTPGTPHQAGGLPTLREHQAGPGLE